MSYNPNFRFQRIDIRLYDWVGRDACEVDTASSKWNSNKIYNSYNNDYDTRCICMCDALFDCALLIQTLNTSLSRIIDGNCLSICHNKAICFRLIFHIVEKYKIMILFKYQSNMSLLKHVNT